MTSNTIRLSGADQTISSVGGEAVTGFTVCWKRLPTTTMRRQTLRGANAQFKKSYAKMLAVAEQNTLRLTGKPRA